MAKTRTSKLDGSELLRLKRFKLTKCQTCKGELNVGDDVTFAKPFANKGFSNPHHTECWESKFY